MATDDASDRVSAVREVGDPVERLRAALDARQAAVAAMWAAARLELDALASAATEAIDEAKRAGVTQSELARRLGVSRQYISRLARGAD